MYALDWFFLQYNLIRLRWAFCPKKAKAYRNNLIEGLIVLSCLLMGFFACFQAARATHG